MGAYDALPDLLVGWGGDTPSRYLSSIDASISSLRLQHLGIDLIPIKSSGYAYVVREEGAPNDFLAEGGGEI